MKNLSSFLLYGVVIATVVAIVVPSAELVAQDGMSLPMGARMTEKLPVWSSEADCGRSVAAFSIGNKEPYDVLTRGELVVFFQLGRECGRISPTGTPEAWIKRTKMKLDPSLPRTAGGYVQKIEQTRAAREAAKPVITACGFLPKKSRYRNGRSAKAGEMFVVFKQRGGYAQVQFLRNAGKGPGGELPLRDLELSPAVVGPVLDGWGKKQYCGTGRYGRVVRFRLTGSGAYYKGPSKQMEPADFYTAGEGIFAEGDYANGWIRTTSGWVSPEHLAPFEYPANGQTLAALRIRAGTTTDAKILTTLSDKGFPVTLYELRGGWYRVTPDGFNPQGFVSAEYVRLMWKGNDNSPAYYLSHIQQEPRQRQVQRSSRQSKEGWFNGPVMRHFNPMGGGGCVIWIIFIIVWPILCALFAGWLTKHVDVLGDWYPPLIGWGMFLCLAVGSILPRGVLTTYATVVYYILFLSLLVPAIYAAVALADYLFNRPPAEKLIKSSLNTRSGKLDVGALRASIGGEKIPSTRFGKRNRTKHYQELTELLQQKETLAKSAEARERLREAMEVLKNL